MDTSKLSPWNWFRKEENSEYSPNPVLSPGNPGLDLYGGPMSTDMEHVFDHMRKRRQSLPGNNGLDLYGGPMSTAMEHVFDELIRRSHERLARGKGSQIETALLKPDLDVTGDGGQYMVAVELPGVEDKDIHVELLDDNSISISGEKRREEEKKGQGYYRMERSYGSFRRILTLPADADISAIKASHKDGVLTISLPRKAADLSGSKRIELTKG